MQYYTRQQLQGSLRYANSVLVGNWNEDRSVKETVLKDFLHKADSATLKIDQFQANMAQALAPAELTVVRDDGHVHFGDVVQLAHAGPSQAVLATDIHDADRRTGENACAATAAPELTKPCARNTFVLTKYTSPRLDIGTTHYDDDVLRYGQKVRVVANSAVRGEELDSGGGSAPLCLFSKPVCPTHFAKYSHHQIAGFTTRSGDYDTVFAVVAPDPADRIASAGVEVLAGAPVCLQHCATSALLCLEAAKYPNEFGSERELSFKTVRPNGKKLLLVHEQHGNLTGTLASKQPAANQFCFVVGSTVQELPAPKKIEPNVNSVLERIHAELAQTHLGFDRFKQKLLRLDTSGSGRLPVAEVQLALNFAGVQPRSGDLDALAARFPTAQHDVMEARALLAQLDSLRTGPQH